ncbi:MAG: RNA polymerase sigma factor [Candidatus Aminicenantes bacterium]|nr:RNA polymerase sigma factor [Candidatus Aminicenantes bacterium]
MVQSLTDTILMAMVRDGKIEKLAVLFERHHVKLYNFFLRLTWNQGVSEDLVQEVFFRILKYRNTYRAESKFTTWLYQIARNTHIDHLRKVKEELPMEEQWVVAVSSESTPEEEVEQDQDIQFIRKALARLPLKKREILLLSRFQDLKYKEIAELMGCQIGTVKATVHRAMKDLSKIYIELSGGVSP